MRCKSGILEDKGRYVGRSQIMKELGMLWKDACSEAFPLNHINNAASEI